MAMSFILLFNLFGLFVVHFITCWRRSWFTGFFGCVVFRCLRILFCYFITFLLWCG